MKTSSNPVNPLSDQRPSTVPSGLGLTSLSLSLSRPQNINPDLRYEHLKQFLDNVTTVMNQHAAIINDMQGEITRKTNDKKLMDSIILLAETLNVYDNDLQKALVAQTPKPRNEKTGNEFEDGLNRLSNKAMLLSHSPAFLYKRLVTCEEKIKSLETKTDAKLDTKNYKEKSKKLKKKVFEDVEDGKKTCAVKVQQVEAMVSTQLAQWEELLREVERKTVWRIQDCEELLRKRINDEYVDLSVRNSEEKLMKAINNISGGGVEMFQRTKDELERKLKSLEEMIGEKMKGTKKIIKDVEEGLLGRLIEKEKYDDDKLKQDTKINDLLFKFKDFTSKNDPTDLLERQNNLIKNLDNKVTNLERELLRKISESLANIAAIDKKEGDSHVDPFQYLDPHKLCSLENDFAVLRNEVHEHRHLIKVLEDDFRKKLKGFDSSLFENIGGLLNNSRNGGGSSGTSKEDVIRLIEQYSPQPNISEDESIKKLKKDLDNLVKRTEGFVELEKRVSRLLREIDINTLTKQIKSKANQDDVSRDNMAFEQKLNALNEMLLNLRKEVDHLSVNIKRNVTNNIQFNTNLDSFNTILSTKKIIPIQCLSCGLQGVPSQPYTKGKVLGTDGKLYKADPNYEQNADMAFKVAGGGYHTYQKQGPSNASISRPNTMQGGTQQAAILPNEGFKPKNGRIMRPGSAKK